MSYDRRLYKEDIQGSRAHAAMLEMNGLLTSDERDAIERGLDEIQKKIDEDSFEWKADREDGE